jgi:hypothetical protein
MNIRISVYIYKHMRKPILQRLWQNISTLFQILQPSFSTSLDWNVITPRQRVWEPAMTTRRDFWSRFFEVIHSLNPKWNLQIGISKMVLLPHVGMFGFHVKKKRRCSWGWKGPKYLNMSKWIIYHKCIYIYIQISTPKIISRNQGGPIQIAPESCYKAQLVETRHVGERLCHQNMTRQLSIPKPAIPTIWHLGVILPVVPHKAVAEVSRIRRYRRGELWCRWTERWLGHVGAVLFGVAAMVAVVTSLTTPGCSVV